jgi:CD36 family.
MSLSFENTTEINGLIGHKFVSDEATFDNGMNVPSRACYCHDVECQPSGTLNVSTCKFGAPAFVSFPHFYLADESYRNAITGMNPVKEEHEFAIYLEPVSEINIKNVFLIIHI